MSLGVQNWMESCFLRMCSHKFLQGWVAHHYCAHLLAVASGLLSNFGFRSWPLPNPHQLIEDLWWLPQEGASLWHTQLHKVPQPQGPCSENWWASMFLIFMNYTCYHQFQWMPHGCVHSPRFPKLHFTCQKNWLWSRPHLHPTPSTGGLQMSDRWATKPWLDAAAPRGKPGFWCWLIALGFLIHILWDLLSII